jgi:aryl-alcohol dehydrogenase-like predicted oxidoreductase
LRNVTLAGGLLASSRLGFGTSTLHHLKTRRARAALLSHCHERGIRHFDTAPLYGHELAEREIGRLIRGRRPDMVVATKFGIEPDPWMSRSSALLYISLAARAVAARLGAGATHDWVKDYEPKRMLKSLERSLRNLRTDYVDLLFAHHAAPASPGFSDELVRELERIRSAGKARFVGLAGNAGDCIALALRYPSISDVLQIDVGAEARSVERAKKARLVPEVTCGHFRSAVKGAASRARPPIIREHLSVAVAENPRGVILFSAQSASRVDGVLKILDEIDPVAA